MKSMVVCYGITLWFGFQNATTGPIPRRVIYIVVGAVIGGFIGLVAGLIGKLVKR